MSHFTVFSRDSNIYVPCPKSQRAHGTGGTQNPFAYSSPWSTSLFSTLWTWFLYILNGSIIQSCFKYSVLISFHLILWYVSNVSSELNYSEGCRISRTLILLANEHNTSIWMLVDTVQKKDKAFVMFLCHNKHYFASFQSVTDSNMLINCNQVKQLSLLENLFLIYN